MEKEKLINLINEINDDEIIRYLYILCNDFIERHYSINIIKKCDSNKWI